MPGQGGAPGGAGTTTAAAAAPWRATDAAALARSWDRARAGSALTVVLTGDAGAGKTQLARGLAARAEDDGGIVISGSAVDVGEQLPLWPVATGLRRLARAADDAPDRVLAARAALEPWREELRPLLDGGTTPAPSGGQLLELVRRVLVGLAARAPVLLVIDDLHWADRTTRELVVSLVAHLADERVLVVVTARSEGLDVTHPLRRMLPELARDRAVRLIELSPLPHEAVATIVRDDGGDADLAGLVWRRSGGNAFIVAETLAAVAEGAADGLSPGCAAWCSGASPGSARWPSASWPRCRWVRSRCPTDCSPRWCAPPTRTSCSRRCASRRRPRWWSSTRTSRATACGTASCATSSPPS
ncbi:AAA family ATPase [Actinomycetospora sp. CA-053990]|uniref:AAA family ATPase n=1 Tax=Actinomycetospora sp. CA-053990 TaxID=3239891 RepID=UPI003D8E718B